VVVKLSNVHEKYTKKELKSNENHKFSFNKYIAVYTVQGSNEPRSQQLLIPLFSDLKISSLATFYALYQPWPCIGFITKNRNSQKPTISSHLLRC